MCQSEKGNTNVLKTILHIENVKGILERQWNKKKSYVKK